MQLLAGNGYCAAGLCADWWTDAILLLPVLVSARAARHLPTDCLPKLVLLSMRGVSAIGLATGCLAEMRSLSLCLRLLRPCVFSPRVSDGHVPHVDVHNHILLDEIADGDIVVR